ncbi:protein NLP4-like isoform X2 [Argentina anserina]|uniref:protein NLP4-like isoform X2 n=1 Tax=Argentina anserina TaxID=57926 RepID=UPI0021762E46|nr:protein NLP4-like isoform X2 [Potentilla anserina]
MEDDVLSPATMLGAPTDSAMDLDFMDELFLDGCWLEATEGPGFPNQSPLNSGAIMDSSFWPTSGTNGNFYANPFQTINQAQTPLFNELQEEAPANIPSSSQTMTDIVKISGQSGNSIIQGHGLSRGIWIGRIENQVSAPSVLERLKMALVYMKDIMRDKNVLVQVWLPVNRGGRRVLTTNDLLSSLDSSCPRLAKYHDISVKYEFSIGGNSKELVEGLPGRVFSAKVPEWTPDVRLFRRDEYPRVGDAKRYDVRGTFALPIFEQGCQTCLGVIEVVTTTQKVQYQPELDSVCKALEAVDLRSSENLNTHTLKVNKKPYQAVLPEIQEVMKSACETHNLPLAQTWVSCIQQGKDGCRHSDDNYVHCVSTVDHACHVADPPIRGFHEACSEHHLLKGQGIVGRAFMTNQPCFSDDITSSGKTEYPLSHHARMFNLHAAVAIRLRSIHTGSTDFVLEFFLPVDCRDPEEHKKMLTSLSLIIQNLCRSLRVVTDKELEEEIDLPVSEVTIPSDPRPSSIGSFPEMQQTDNDVSIIPKEKARKMPSPRSSKFRPQDLNVKEGVDSVGEFSKIGEGSFSSVGVSKTGEKRRTKAEKAITLEVLRKYFSGNLKDAAKSLGVCSTTLKRICRQHGIKRWPSRKIKKVGHSLEKLQRVIDSVQGASSVFQINSFYTNYPELASPNLSGTSPFSTSKLIDQSRPSDVPPEGGVLSPQATASKSPSSSCSQSSSSSQCCSSKTEQCLPTWSVAGSDDPIGGDNRMLKRVRSEAELNALRQIGVEELMQRSQSHKNLCEQQNLQSFCPPLKYDGQIAQDGAARKVKVTYGDEKTRFRIQNNWRFGDLEQEIAKRFGINDMSRFDIKYLDDDSEWVLLTCDADLDECLEVCRSSRCSTIKLSVQLSRRRLERFLGSGGPS